MGLDYSSSGVDIDAESSAVASLIGSLGRSTRKPGTNGAPVALKGGFGGLLEFGDRWLALATDGVGSKLQIANAMCRYQGVGIDCVAMNVNDLLCVGAIDNFILSSTIGRNKHLIDGDVVSAVINSSNELIKMYQGWGINIFSAGGETADVGDVVRTLILDNTILTRLKKEDVINNANISPGDVIIGLSSSGQTTYESEYNSGIGSNGLTSARHDVFHNQLAMEFPESFNSFTDADLVYSGSKSLFDKINNITLGKLVLSPTRTYAPVVKEIFKDYKKYISGMVHCTGGGQTKILHFIKNLHIIKNNMFTVPPIFNLIKKESSSSWREMYQVFNMGHRMELYVKKEVASSIIDVANSFNLDAQIIGSVESSIDRKLTIYAPGEILVY